MVAICNSSRAICIPFKVSLRNAPNVVEKATEAMGATLAGMFAEGDTEGRQRTIEEVVARCDALDLDLSVDIGTLFEHQLHDFYMTSE